MSSASPKMISTRTARIVFFGCPIAAIGVYLTERFAFDFPDGSLQARTLGGVLLPVILLIFGGFLTAAMVMGQKVRIDWRGFIRFAIDFALLPLTIPFLMVTCLKIGHAPITYFATPWFGEQFAGMLGFEFGTFVVLMAVPYAMYIWPILHRVRRSPSPDGYLLAPKTWVVMSGFLLFSLLIVSFGPPIELSILVCVSWLCFCAVYHWLLLPIFPRYNLDSSRDSPESPKAG